MAILDMVERIRKAWEKGEHCLGVFIDFRKASDTVDHSILLSTLEHMGIRGVPLELLKSYLSNRNQYVVFGSAESTQQEIAVGVPQGRGVGQHKHQGSTNIRAVNTIFKVRRHLKSAASYSPIKLTSNTGFISCV